MNRVIHFEIHASDPVKIGEFYQQVFGWAIKKWDNPHSDYWFVMTGPESTKDGVSAEPGINGGMSKREGPLPQDSSPVTSFVCVVDVSDVDETVRKVESAGGKVTSPKNAIPGMAWIAYCKDPDGNVFGLFQEDATAK